MFDSAFKKARRQYNREKSAEIEQLVSNNPKEFWKRVKNLGPKNEKESLVNEVKLPDDSVSRDPRIVKETWEHDFSQLFTE